MHSPLSGKGYKRSGNDLYPLLMPEKWRGALRHFACESSWKESKITTSPGEGSRNKQGWTMLPEAWSGLMLIGLNTSLGHCTETGVARGPLQKGVLDRLFRDAVSFVEGDGLSKEVVRRPEVSWGRRIGDMSISYGGEIVEKS